IRGVSGNVHDRADRTVTHAVEFLGRWPGVDRRRRRRLNVNEEALGLFVLPDQNERLASSEASDFQDSPIDRDLTHGFVEDENLAGSSLRNGDRLIEEHLDDLRRLILAKHGCWKDNRCQEQPSPGGAAYAAGHSGSATHGPPATIAAPPMCSGSICV